MVISAGFSRYVQRTWEEGERTRRAAALRRIAIMDEEGILGGGEADLSAA